MIHLHIKLKKFAVIFLFLAVAFFQKSSYCDDNDPINEKILRIGLEPILQNLFNKFSDNFYHQISYIKINNFNERYNTIRKICQSDDIPFLIVTNPLSDYEKMLCKNYNEELLEEKIGYFAFVFITSNKEDRVDLTSSTIFKGLSTHTMKNFNNSNEQYKSWYEINKSFPKSDIKIYGPFAESQGFEFLSNIFIKNNCMANAYNQEKFPDFLKLQKFCQEIKKDGSYIGDSVDGRLTIEKVFSEKSSYGIVSYDIYEKHKDSFVYKNFDGVEPSRQNILNDKYPLSYPILIYYKKSVLSSSKLAKDFFQEIKNKNTIGQDGLLANYGLVSIQK